jgi:glycosyltransferase involved in cell wall biosynthesis
MSKPDKQPVWVQTATNVNMILNFGRNLTEIIKGSDVDYHVIYSPEQNKSNADVIADELIHLGATLHEIPMKQQLGLKPLFGLLVSFLNIFFLLRRLKPDVFYTRGTLMGMVGRPAAWLAGVEGIFHHQDDFYHREETLSTIKKKIYRKLETLLARITTRLFFVSQTIYDEALAMGIPAEKCANVGHDLHPIFQEYLDKSSALADSIRRNVRRPEDEFIVGVLGRIENFKGIDTVLKVAKKLAIEEPRIRFFIRGIGSQYEKVAMQIEREGLSKTVRLTKKYFSTESMPDLFRSFDVFFLPTRREGFGMVFAEAMSMGVPVVCPRIYPVVEVVPEDMGYLVDAEDVEGYVDAILRLFKDSEGRARLGQKARHYAVDRWAGRKSAQQVFDKLCDSGGDPSNVV